MGSRQCFKMRQHNMKSTRGFFQLAELYASSLWKILFQQFGLCLLQALTSVHALHMFFSGANLLTRAQMYWRRKRYIALPQCWCTEHCGYCLEKRRTSTDQRTSQKLSLWSFFIQRAWRNTHTKKLAPSVLRLDRPEFRSRGLFGSWRAVYLQPHTVWYQEARRRWGEGKSFRCPMQ